MNRTESLRPYKLTTFDSLGIEWLESNELAGLLSKRPYDSAIGPLINHFDRLKPQQLDQFSLIKSSPNLEKTIFNASSVPDLQRLSRRIQTNHTDDDWLTGQSRNSRLVGNIGSDSVAAFQPFGLRSLPPKWAYLSQQDTRSSRIGALNSSETVSTFDLKANLSNQDTFYKIPYPSDLRLDAKGYADLSGFPIWDGSKVIQGLKGIADDYPGFPTTSVGYFRFNSPVSKQKADRLIPARINAPILLIDVDPNSPQRGQLLPTVASTPRPDENYVPDDLLAVAPYPGIVLHPDRRYAYVVQRSLKDANGQLLGVPGVLKQLMNGKTPQGPLGAKASQLYQPLWETLDQLGIDRKSVAAATVFTTRNVVADTATLSQQMVDRYDLTIEGLALDPTDGARHSRFWELHGTVRFPQFQQGQPPFNNQGLFKFAKDGTLIEQRTEVAPVTITIPKTPMPVGGYPVVAYYHGSNGLSTQVVDRGPIKTPGGQPAPGLGPAHVLAEYGFATISSALPLNPQRLPNAPSDAYRNLNNLAAYRDTFRQGVIEQRLLLEALDQLVISPVVISNAAASLLPAGETAFQFQTASVLAMGQSHGAQYANMLGAIEPTIKAVVPTGSPGFWSLLLPKTQFSPLIGFLLGTSQPLDPLYPGLHLLQTAWEAADPIAYMPFIANRPLAGQPVRSIYQPVGKGDTEVPEVVFDALALASRVKQAGPKVWPGMQTSLALGGLGGIVKYPVLNNVRSENGTPYTGVVVQYRGDGIADPHTIFSQLDAVKFQYANFFRSFIDTGTAIVPKP